MFRKIFTLLFVLLMVVLFSSNVTQAQTTKKNPVYPAFSITPLFGVQFPLGDLNNIYSPSFNAGLDLNLRVNRETSFYLGAGYYNLPEKNDPKTGPDASYIIIQAGPRYLFGGPQLKAMFFIEGGIGAYIFTTKDFTTTVAGTSVTIAGASTTNFGVNGGIGVLIPLGTSMDFVVKTKMHYIFSSGDSGAATLLAANMGLNFMF